VNAAIPIGITLNNPLNIRRTTDVWVGMDTTYQGPYVRFTAPEYCYRAGSIILHGYSARGINWLGYKADGTRGVIPTWAPPEDGHPTDEYIANVCTWCGVAPTDVVPVPSLVLLRSMTRQEIGQTPYPDSTIELGMTLANPNGEDL